MNRSGVECRDELCEIGGMRRNAKLLPVILPRAGPEISLGKGDESILLGNLLSDRFPGAKVGDCSMDKDDRIA